MFSCSDNEKYDEKDVNFLKSKYSKNSELSKKILNSTYTITEDNIMHGIKTILNLKKLREYYISENLDGTGYSKLAELLENEPLKLFNEVDNNRGSLVKSRESLIKYSILVFNEYADFERLFENDIDSFSIQEVLKYKVKSKGFETLNKITQRHLVSNDTLDLYQNLLFVEAFHNDLINSIIKLNSVESSIYSQSLPDNIETKIESISKDSVKITFEINGNLNSSNLLIMWSNDADFETRNTNLGKHLNVHQENDSIYGQIRFYRADTVHWIPWKTSIQHGLTAR